MKTKEKEHWGREAAEMIMRMLTNDISLPGNACVFLAFGKGDFMSGRYVDTTINFQHLLQAQDSVVHYNLFKVGVSGQLSPLGRYSFLQFLTYMKLKIAAHKLCGILSQQ